MQKEVGCVCVCVRLTACVCVCLTVHVISSLLSFMFKLLSPRCELPVCLLTAPTDWQTPALSSTHCFDHMYKAEFNSWQLVCFSKPRMGKKRAVIKSIQKQETKTRRESTNVEALHTHRGRLGMCEPQGNSFFFFFFSNIIYSWNYFVMTVKYEQTQNCLV